MPTLDAEAGATRGQALSRREPRASRGRPPGHARHITLRAARRSAFPQFGDSFALA